VSTISTIDGTDKDFHNLIKRLNNGDEDAFAELYQKYCGRVAFVCRKFCDNKEDVEEIVQDTFLIAFKKSVDLRVDTLLAYLRKIAIRESIRKHNASSRRQQLIINSDELLIDAKEIDENFLPEDALTSKERNSELMRIIESLSKLQREMIYMYYFADFSSEEIANLFECSLDSVYKTLSRGRQSIKTKLEGKDRKKAIIATAFIPLSAFFIMEEQAFAANYNPAANPFATTNTAVTEVATATANATKSIKGYIIATSAVTAGIVVATLYFSLLTPNEDHYTRYPYEPAYTSYVPFETENITEEIEPIPPPPEEYDSEQEQEPNEIIEGALSEELDEITQEPTYQTEPHTDEPLPEEIYTPAQEEIPEPERPPPIEEPEAETQAEEESTEPPPIITPPEPADTPEEEPEEALQTEPETVEPVHIDRTAEILAALATASTAGETYRIINHFGFSLLGQMRHGALDEQFRFYTTNEGSGDILIGMVALENGSGWRMRFDIFVGSEMPLVATDRLEWMEQ